MQLRFEVHLHTSLFVCERHDMRCAAPLGLSLLAAADVNSEMHSDANASRVSMAECTVVRYFDPVCLHETASPAFVIAASQGVTCGWQQLTHMPVCAVPCPVKAKQPTGCWWGKQQEDVRSFSQWPCLQ